MKVLQLTTHLNVGGVAKYVLDLSRGLLRRGIDVFVASSGGDLESAFTDSSIGLVDVGIKTKFEFHPKLIPQLVKLARFVNISGIDVIHVHTRVAQIVGCIISRCTKTPFVSTCHGFFNAKRISRKIFPCWGDMTISISDAVRKHLKDDFNVHGDKIEVIYNGVAENGNADEQISEGEKNALRKDLGLSSGPVIGAIGRLSPVKGYDHLLHAVNEIRKKISNINVLIIGEGPLRKGLMQLTESLNLGANVFFVGSRLDIHRFFLLMDVFVFPSRQEGLGLALLEAMARGKACVATGVGGIANVIENNKNGLLVPPGDPDKLAKTIEILISDKALALRLGRAAKKSVADRFSLDKMVDKTIECYNKILRQ